MGTDEPTGRAGGSTSETTAEDVLATSPSNAGLDSALVKPPRRRGRLSSTMLLIVGVLVAAGFLGGLLPGRSTAPANGTVVVRGDSTDDGSLHATSIVEGDTGFGGVGGVPVGNG